MTRPIRTRGERKGKILHKDQVLVPMSFRARAWLHAAAREAGYTTKKSDQVVIAAFVRMVLAESPRVQRAAEQYGASVDDVIQEFTHIKPGGPFVQTEEESDGS